MNTGGIAFVSWTCRTALIIVSCSIPLHLVAQDEVVLVSGQSVKGAIDRLTPAFVRILSYSTNKTEVIYADRIISVQRKIPNNYLYFSKNIVSVNSKQGANVARLVQLRGTGAIKTYSMYEGAGRSTLLRYYLEKENSELIFIGSTSGFFSIPYDLLVSNEIVRQVSKLFDDQPGIKSRYEADTKRVKRKIIQQYVQEYNQLSAHP